MRLIDADAIDKMLPMQPEQTGKWIGIGDIPTTCPFCDEDWDKYIIGDKWYTGETPNFCPNCGARILKEGD